MANIKVAVRVRPISKRESKNCGSSVIVYTEQNRISLTNLKIPANKAGDSRERTRKYRFDYCFDSSDPRSDDYADQAKIYEVLGKSLLGDLFAGYTSCLLAYGQSASGKTYTVMGTEDEPGLTPRLCQGIFARIEEEKDKGNFFDVSISYLEIYNERVRDLLEPSSSSHRSLKVREHPRLGPYVQGLTRRVATTLERLMSYVVGGTKVRKTGNTSQNANSSRSHTLLTVFLSPEATKTGEPIAGSVDREATDKVYDDATSTPSRRNPDIAPHYGSKLHLVDLAGGETARKCDGVNRLKEGANINKSLVALGNVISALTGRSSTAAGSNRRYIPYRDSSLTWLLKDALGGNATTIMLATISPASRNYNETAHTLRFAQRAHSVVNKPVVNEDPMARTIRELKAEIARLKSLLLEKNIEPDTKSLSYRAQHELTTNSPKRRKTLPLGCGTSKNKRTCLDDGILPIIRRVNSSEDVTTRDSDLVNSTIRKFDSYECLLDRKSVVSRNGCSSYNRAKISELDYEERELVDEINEAVFVDIPTLVAVLIKPDNTFDENSSAQIEEICSEEIQEYPIEPDFIDRGESETGVEEIARKNHRRRGKLTSDEYEEEESRFDSALPSSVVNVIGRRSEGNDSCDPYNLIDSIGRKEKAKFRKQDSISVTTPIGPSTNLYTLSRNFGSAEILEKKRDRLGTLERSNTSLEKQAAVPEETDERYNDDSKNSSCGSLWKDGTNHFQRAASNESDKISKDNSSAFNTNKIRNSNVARKPSLENLKRKTSKDSSSSSSKDEQILISSLASERILRRKDSLDHSASTRTHTPVQRAKRAEIVAAVTERLYSSRKQVEETATGLTGSMIPTSSTSFMSSVTGASSMSGGVRTPPEGTDVRPTTSTFTTKTKLQEISRKMLAKRRRVNVDTQTERMQTIRMKDSSSSTDESKIVCQDVGILTDEHTDNRIKMDHRLPILRVKEIATSTDKLKSNVKESCKDAECLVNDLNFYEYGVDFFRSDPKESPENGRYYTANKMSSTDSLELCLANDERVNRFDKSTSTTNAMLAVERNSIVQMQPREPIAEDKKTTQYFGERCNVVHNSKDSIPSSIEKKPDRNAISMSLSDAISITIESTNFLESRVVLLMDDTLDGTNTSSDKREMQELKNGKSQTEKQDIDRKDKGSNRCLGGLATKSSLNQTDNKCFRIENIFEDPRNVSRIRTEEASLKMSSERRALKTSVTFTNSLGTCFVPETKECATGMEKGQVSGQGSMERSEGEMSEEISRRDKMIDARDKINGDSFRHPTDIWKNWIVSFPPASWQRPRNLLSSSVNVEPWTFTWNNSLSPLNDECAAIVSSANLKAVQEEPIAINSAGHFLSNDLFDNKNRISDSLKSPPGLKRVVEQDYNFSDDSLDYNEETVLSSNTNKNNNSSSKKTETTQVKEEGFENICPPDVVAHTTRESSMLVGNTICDNGIDSSPTCLLEKNQIDVSKKNPHEPKAGTSIFVHDYKSLILGQRSVNVDSNNPREGRIDLQEISSSDCGNDDTCQKRVTFFDSEILDERGQGSRSGETNSLNRNWNLPKAVIKRKTQESDKNDDDDSRIVDTAVIEDHFEDTNKIQVDLAEDERKSILRGKTKYMNVLKISNDKSAVSFEKEDSFENGRSDSDSYDDVGIDQDFIKNCVSMKLKRKLLEEYLKEATAFMRNINSLNEYVSSNATVCKRHQREEKKKRGNHRRFCAPRNYENCYAKLENGALVVSDASDDNLLIDKPLKENDMIAPIESFEKCLEGLARLENCIRKANEHDRYLREKYGIAVESTGAKSGLANSSIDSNTNSKISSNLIQRDSIIPLQEECPIRSETSDISSERTLFKDPSMTRMNEESKNLGDSSLRVDDKLYGTNNKVVCVYDELERRNLYRLTNTPSSCHYCCTKNTHVEHSYREPAYYDTYRLYRSHKDDRNTNNPLDDSIATMNGSIQLSASDLVKSTRCCERLEKSLGDTDRSSRQTMTDAFLRCTKSETSNCMNSRSFHRLATSLDTKSYTWKRLRYRPESPRAKFLELLRERRRIVESSKDIRS